MFRQKFYISNIIIFFYINKEKIIVGIFNKDDSFIPKYVFIYNSDKLVEEEKDKMISSNINDYLKQRNCDAHSKSQKLVDEKGEIIGLLFILNQIPKKSNSKLPEEIEKKQLQINSIKNDNQRSNTTNKNENFDGVESQQNQNEKQLIKPIKMKTLTVLKAKKARMKIN